MDLSPPPKMTSNDVLSSSLKVAPGYNTQPAGEKLAVYYRGKSKDVVVSRLKPIEFIGQATTGWTAQEYGDSWNRVTVLTAVAPATITVSSGAQAAGQAIYTFPSKDIAVGGAGKISGGIVASSAPAATPQIGVGTVIGSGASATLATATFKNIVTANVMSALDGTVNTFADAQLPVPKLAGSTPQAFLNVAATWAGADTLTIQPGFTVIMHWKVLDITEEMS